MGEGIVRELGMDMPTLLYLKWTSNKDLQTQGTLHSVRWQPGWEEFGEGIHGYVWLSPSLFTQNYHNLVCSLAIPQHKIKKFKREREREMERESYYQELTPVITEADMSQDLQGELARWRPKNATVWF